MGVMMIAKIIDKCVYFMVRQGVVQDTDEQKAIYSYGLELQLYFIIHAVLLILMGCFFGSGFEVSLLLLLFGMLQVNAGGYHAKTHMRCFVTMMVGVLLFLWLLPIFQGMFFLQLCSVVLGVAIIFLLAPVAHKNHPLSPMLSVRLGQRAKIIAVGFMLLWCIFIIFDINSLLRGIIPVVMAFTVFSLLCAWLKKKRFSVFEY